MADLIRINGRVIERDSGESRPDIRVEAWDNDHIIDYTIGAAITQGDGMFQMELSESYLHELFAGREPQLFFRVFFQDALLGTTEHSLVWNFGYGETPMEIYTSRITDQIYTGIGWVIDESTGKAMESVRVEAWDNRHGIGYTIGSARTRDEGMFSLAFAATFIHDTFEGHDPQLCFRIFAGGILLMNTQDMIVWDPRNAENIYIVVPSSAERIYTIGGRTFDADLDTGIAALRVELWDAEQMLDSSVGSSITGAYGEFSVSFKETVLYDIFQGRYPTIFFKVFSGSEPLTSTEDSIVWDMEWRGEIAIPVGRSEDHIYTIVGRVFDESSGQGVPGSSVEIWDNHHIVNYSIGTVFTNAVGVFAISFTDSFFRATFGNQSPLLYFKIFSDGSLLKSTENAILWHTGTLGELPIPVQMEQTYTLVGRITGQPGQNVAGLRVEVWDNHHIVGYPIATITSGADGEFLQQFTRSFFQALFGEQAPLLFFKIFSGSTLVVSTENAIQWTTSTAGELPVPLPPPPDEIYSIVGQLSRASGGSLAGLRVESWDNDHIVNTIIGTATTDADGTFRMDFTGTFIRGLFGDHNPQLFFKVFSGTTLLANTENSIVLNLHTGENPVALPLDSSPGTGSTDRRCAPTDATTYTIAGTISSSDRASIGGLQIQLVDKGIGQDVLLAEATTNSCGDYELAFDAAAVEARGKHRPDLQAKVYSNGTLIAASEVRYNADGNETLDVVLPPGSTAMQSEHDTLKQALGAHYAGQLRALQESDERQDITYLANKSGWDARAVAMAALADQFGADSTVDPTFFYALFRAGLAANEQTIYHTDTNTLQNVWTAATEQGIIPQSRAAEIPQMVDKFKTLSAGKLLSGPPLVGPSSLRTLLTASGLPEAQQQAFAAMYTAHRTDPPALWAQVEASFGSATAQRLQIDGKLAVLTVNNAPLITSLRQSLGGSSLHDPVELAQAGYYRASKWAGLLHQGMSVPEEIPGDTAEARQANYAEYMAAQIRLSYPTASMAAMVTQGELPVNDAEGVREFVATHQGSFEIGTQPVEQYIAENGLSVQPVVVADIKRIERVYQITQTDEAMTGLLSNGLESASHVARYDKDAFVETFGANLGGAEKAEQIHDRSMQIHNAVLNITISYLAAKNGLSLGAPPLGPGETESNGARQILQPAPMGPGSVNLYQPPAGSTGDVLAYTTLESLFGEMDFCSCDHCRSILSPAAYLVDLLYFIDQTAPPPGTMNPQTVLFERRPDIQHIPLTCENTNTALPYIDVVNETLEYYIANSVQALSLTGYLGHDTGTMASEDLLASPAFVMDAAYTALASQRFPAPLPFHQPLENLRRHFEKFDMPLSLAMERLRPNDNLERGAAPYGWRDILMEELNLSRAEYEILVDSTTVPLWRMYGFPSGTVDPTVIASLCNAKKFSRRVGISYEELAAILRTRFINPSADLIPKLERLGVSFGMLQALKVNNNPATDAQFDALLPTGAGTVNPAEYGGNIKAWVKDPTNYARIMGLIVLTDTTPNADPCSFDTLELRFAKPMVNSGDTSTRLGAVEFIRILRFIRLWKKTGWTIEQTDAAICALYRTDMAPLTDTDIDTAGELDTGFLTLLPRLGIVVRLMRALNLTPKRDLLAVLALWSPIGTAAHSLYRQMFLNPTILKQDPVYADNGYGDFLNNVGIYLANHAESVRAAMNLSGDEYDRIIGDLGFTATTPLSITTISAIFRRGYLARALRISVQELLLLIDHTGLDPFSTPNLSDPAVLRLAAIVDDLKELGLKPTSALYLLWNQNLSGQSAPDTAQINAFARSLRENFSTIEQEFAIADDPSGEIARARMTLVYGAEAADFFFGLLNDAFVSEASYSHFDSAFGPVLSAAITAAAGTYGPSASSRLAYNDFRKHLTFAGVMSLATRNAIKAVATAPAVVTEVNAIAPGSLAAFQTLFPAAVDALYAANNAAVSPFFARYAELLPLYQTFVLSGDAPATKRTALLANILPSLIHRRKAQQALQRLSDAAGTSRTFADGLANAVPASGGLHRAGNAAEPALNDLLELEQQGLSAQFYSSDTVGTNPHAPTITKDMVYAAASANTLPANMVTPGNAISGVWSGSIEAPETGLYIIIIEADMGATVRLKIDGALVGLTQVGTTWSNTASLSLKGGTLYAIELTVEKVSNTMRLQWETAGRGRAPIPARLLYPAGLLTAARESYLRFLKAGALATALNLTAAEIARPVLSGVSWLNAIPVIGNAVSPATLLAPLRELLDYARVKAGIAANDESLLTVMRDPATATAEQTSLLYTLTGWDQASLNALVARFVGSISGLSQPSLLRRVYEAFALVRGMGISAGALIAATTNEPVATTVRDLQAALRARYAAEDWRTVVQPINDAMRSMQRDALVTYILHQMRSNPTTEHIDTADKLFEYFLMDVQMEPCMQTSRIRHALSSVQLFIERCMMNLEPRVSPRSLSAKQWEWMKRYRVWEANRKVFLYPENWLEPELRDDKSPFFKEIEGELLQSDITEESATIAMLNYLSKLEEVAKLEPCGFYHIPADLVKRVGEVSHVVARTPGAHRKYYYRRREYGYWTPWEHIKLDIEDNPVMPVVWRDRLLLFWVKVLKTGPSTATMQGQKPTGETLGEMALPTPTQTTYVVLCWSEYYNGKWQPTKTSDLEHPVSIGNYAPGGPGAFDRSRLNIEVREEADALQVTVIGGNQWGRFRLYNTHSVPLQDNLLGISYLWSRDRWYTGNDVSAFSFRYVDNWWATDLARNVLKPLTPFNIVPPRHPLSDPWHAPMFYQDNRHVFYVSSTQQEVPLWLVADYGVWPAATAREAGTIPGVVTATAPAAAAGARSWSDGAVPGSGTAINNTGTVRQFVTEDANIRMAIGTTEQVAYGDKQIGPGGALAKA